MIIQINFLGIVGVLTACSNIYNLQNPVHVYFGIHLKVGKSKMVPNSDSVRVYTVNGAATGSSSSLPDWLTRKRLAKGKGKKRVIKDRIEGTIELIQGFEFPEASNRVKTTRDGHHVIATGTYKPQMRVWDLDQLSLKFERHSDSENVDFAVRELLALPDRYSKGC